MNGENLTGPRLALFPLSIRLPNLEFLHPEERKILELIGPARIEKWLAVRWGLKWLVGQLMAGLDPSEINTVDGSRPKIKFPDGKRWWASAAHDGQYLLVAVDSHGSLGVDVEKPSYRCLRLALKYCPSMAKDELSACRWWTSHEALAKASGTSLTGLLRRSWVLGNQIIFGGQSYLFRFWNKAGRVITCCSSSCSEPVFLTSPKPADIGTVSDENDW